MDDDVNHGTLQLDLFQADLPLDERDNVQTHQRAVDVRVG